MQQLYKSKAFIDSSGIKITNTNINITIDEILSDLGKKDRDGYTIVGMNMSMVGEDIKIEAINDKNKVSETHYLSKSDKLL